MVIYGGKNATVYFAEQQIDLATEIKISLENRRSFYTTYQGQTESFPMRTTVRGSIDSLNVGSDFIYYIFPHKEVVDNSLIVQDSSDTDLHSFGNYKLSSEAGYPIYSSITFDQKFYLREENLNQEYTNWYLGSASNTQISFYFTSFGSPTNAVYVADLYRPDDTIAVTDIPLCTWDTTGSQWQTLGNITAFHNPNDNPYYFRIRVDSGTTASNQCLVLYVTSDGDPPYLGNGSTNAICNFNIARFKPSSRYCDMRVELDSGNHIDLYDVAFGDFDYTYGAAAISEHSIPFRAKSFKIYQ